MNLYVNEVHLIGRIGKEPEIAKTNDGRSIMKFSLATTDRWTDKISHEKKEKTEWHKIVVYNNERLCEFYESLKEKNEELSGALVRVCGKLKYEEWENKNNGVKQKSTSIVVDSFSGKFEIIERRRKQEKEKNFEDISNDQNKQNHENVPDSENYKNYNFMEETDDSDDIPF